MQNVFKSSSGQHVAIAKAVDVIEERILSLSKWRASNNCLERQTDRRHRNSIRVLNMASLNGTLKLSLWAWLFRQSMDELEEAYASARSAADSTRERLNREWEEFKREVDEGHAKLYEENDDGQVVYDHGDEMWNRDQQAEGVLKLVREAFVISLHHFWEREINRRSKRTRYEKKKAFKFLEEAGLQLEKESLTALRLAANVAKHSEGGSADDLYLLRPDLFDAKAIKEGEKPGFSTLIITDEVAARFFEAVRRSGPRVPSQTA
ncbi:hypothetical protein [Rhizobium leguminosarum]|uniref:hypothetical protein n=1 Tax=Rhizobium leguminosarum TaxID=384 RepID=UPI0015B8FAF1|nr:hypothetical protein [Rhizobium leguminosarum]